MSFEISSVSSLMAKALNFRATRQNIISSNIANADTPAYRPKDIKFEHILQNKTTQLPLLQTSAKHLKSMKNNDLQADIYFRDNIYGNDENGVDIDIETTQMSKNTIMFNALIKAIKADTKIFRSVIDASARLR